MTTVTTTGRSADRYGPKQQCERTACTTDGPADHLGGAHLDPRDRERFDGNGTSLRAVTYRVRDKFYALDQVGRTHPELTEVIDVALHAALREIDGLNQQIAHVRVDADHKVRDASRRALDCEHHGKVIQQLENQITLIDKAEQRAEKARLALLGGVHAFDDFIRGVDEATALGRPLPDIAEVITAIRKVLKKVHAAHTRAWSR